MPTADAKQHGPDVGSDEWKSTIEFRLGIRGKPGIPARGTDAWCAHVAGLLATAPAAKAGKPAKGPAFSCAKVEPGSIESLICNDAALSALDRKMDATYAAARKKAANERPSTLQAEQRGWVKGRNDCWKADDKPACVSGEYKMRIAELQARYRLVPHTGPVRYVCNGDPRNEVVAMYFKTDPPSLIAERGDSVSFMTVQAAASGASYRGRNETLWEHQGEATIVWGPGAPEMRCKVAP
ncbi:MAG: MliC family protein [Burkholderiales bacterium]|nr:MliC family protein [Burkholderiales bacterium]